MEQSPSIESFSYSWLANHDEPPPSSFIEMDPRLPPSKRFIRVSSDFAFDFPISDGPLGLVHADELISNGFLLPLFLKDDRVKMEDDYYSTPAASSSASTAACRRGGCASLRRVSKRFILKYWKLLLRPFLYPRRRRSVAMRSWELSAATSPRTSVAYSLDDNWRRSCDSESSIYEAVLHCKRTQGK